MRNLLLATVCGTALLAGTPAWAQNAAARSTAEPEGGEIVVTATRQESLASKTPIALTAVTGSALNSAGVTNPTALGEMVPNLAIDRGNSASLRITIRGVSSADATEKGDPSAAFMVDGIYIARPQVHEVSFFDLQRVEVLRGPQGTLYGRNTTAGVVNLISAKPKLGELSGSAEAGYGNYNAVQGTGVINLPVAENVALRAAVNYDRRDSYLIPGPNFKSSIDPFRNNLSFRVSTLFKLDRGELVLRGDYSRLGGTTANQVPFANFLSNFRTTGTTPTDISSTKTNDQLRTINSTALFSSPVDRQNSTWGITADFNYDLGPVTAYYVGAYRDFRRHEDGVNIRNQGVIMSPSRFDANYWQHSHEVRFALNGDGPLKLQAGAYYFFEKSGLNFYNFGFGGQAPNTAGYITAFIQRPTRSESYALFSQATYSFTPQLRMTAGIRYSHDDKSRVGAQLSCTTTACNQPGDSSAPNNAARKFARTTWRLGLDYDLTDRTLLYGIVSTGYKAGGFNDGCLKGSATGCTLAENDLYYQPETLTAFEIGAKTRLGDLRLNLSGFHYDYKNLQLTSSQPCVADPTVTCATTRNAAVAKIDGIEVEGQYRLTPNDMLDFSGTWLNARFDQYALTTAISWNGYRLDRAPRWTGTFGYQHTVDLGANGRLDLGLRTRVTSSYKLADYTAAYQLTQRGFTKTDITATYHADGDAWFLQAYLRNIENKVVITATSTGPAVHGALQLGDPRTFGVRFGAKF